MQHEWPRCGYSDRNLRSLCRRIGKSDLRVHSEATGLEPAFLDWSACQTTAQVPVRLCSHRQIKPPKRGIAPRRFGVCKRPESTGDCGKIIRRHMIGTLRRSKRGRYGRALYQPCGVRRLRGHTNRQRSMSRRGRQRCPTAETRCRGCRAARRQSGRGSRLYPHRRCTERTTLMPGSQRMS